MTKNRHPAVYLLWNKVVSVFVTLGSYSPSHQGCVFRSHLIIPRPTLAPDQDCFHLWAHTDLHSVHVDKFKSPSLE